MKAILLQSLWINGVPVVHEKDGPTIVEVPDNEYESLVDRGVVRAVTKADLALAGIEDAEVVEPEPEPESQPEPEPVKKTRKQSATTADDDL